MNTEHRADPLPSGGPARLSKTLHEDLVNMVEGYDQNRPGRWWLQVVAKTALYPRIRAVAYFRLSQFLAGKRLVALAYAVQSRTIRISGTEISPFATIGPGLCLAHSVGIVVGPDVVAGRNLRLHQGVTLGDGTRAGQPVIGDDVLIGAGAAVLGGISIGSRVIVGANAVVTRDVEDDSIAVGIPATSRPRRY